MLQIEETTKKTSERTREKKDSITDSRQKKVDGHPIRKQKSSSIAIKIFRDNRHRSEKRSQRKGVQIRAEKRANEDLLDKI